MVLKKEGTSDWTFLLLMYDFRARSFASLEDDARDY